MKRESTERKLNRDKQDWAHESRKEGNLKKAESMKEYEAAELESNRIRSENSRVVSQRENLLLW